MDCPGRATGVLTWLLLQFQQFEPVMRILSAFLFLFIIFQSPLAAASLFKKKDAAEKEAKLDARLEKRVEKISDYFEQVMDSPESTIPPGLLRKAEGIIIMRQFKVGMGLGIKGGGGIAMARDGKNGQWSAPAFLKAGEASIGLQLGGQMLDSVFLLMNEKGMNLLSQTQFRIGVDAAATAGPHGAEAEVKYSGDVPILVYSNIGGLYAGATFESGFLVPDNKANAAYYNDEAILMGEILFKNKVEKTAEAKKLIELIEQHSGK